MNKAIFKNMRADLTPDEEVVNRVLANASSPETEIQTEKSENKKPAYVKKGWGAYVAAAAAGALLCGGVMWFALRSDRMETADSQPEALTSLPASDSSYVISSDDESIYKDPDQVLKEFRSYEEIKYLLYDASVLYYGMPYSNAGTGGREGPTLEDFISNFLNRNETVGTDGARRITIKEIGCTLELIYDQYLRRVTFHKGDQEIDLLPLVNADPSQTALYDDRAAMINACVEISKMTDRAEIEGKYTAVNEYSEGGLTYVTYAPAKDCYVRVEYTEDGTPCDIEYNDLKLNCWIDFSMANVATAYNGRLFERDGFVWADWWREKKGLEALNKYSDGGDVLNVLEPLCDSWQPVTDTPALYGEDCFRFGVFDANVKYSGNGCIAEFNGDAYTCIFDELYQLYEAAGRLKAGMSFVDAMNIVSDNYNVKTEVGDDEARFYFYSYGTGDYDKCLTLTSQDGKLAGAYISDRDGSNKSWLFPLTFWSPESAQHASDKALQDILYVRYRWEGTLKGDFDNVILPEGVRFNEEESDDYDYVYENDSYRIRVRFGADGEEIAGYDIADTYRSEWRPLRGEDIVECIE